MRYQAWNLIFRSHRFDIRTQDLEQGSTSHSTWKVVGRTRFASFIIQTISFRNSIKIRSDWLHNEPGNALGALLEIRTRAIIKILCNRMTNGTWAKTHFTHAGYR
jgi:hypothetical protein